MNNFKHKILLVEDDPNLGLITKESLELQEYEVTLTNNGKSGEEEFMRIQYDLCLIDIMLPLKDGFSLAKSIRKIDPNIPIIFLTAKALKEDKIEGFRIGCDDYITKPFSIEELILRMQAVLRRSKPNVSSIKNQCHQIGKYTFDLEHQILENGKIKKHLTYKEAQLLNLLCLHLNKILERDVALKLIWEDNSIFNARSMDVYITKLRKYLSEDPGIQILNIHGKGFKFIVE